MHVAQLLQYTSLVWLLIGALGVVVAVVNHREQVKTQIFLEMSGRYDEISRSVPAHFWLGFSKDTPLGERNDETSIAALRFCALVSLTYFLYREHRIPKRMWKLMLGSAERRMRTPFFVREWGHVRSEFESFPEFAALVDSVLKRSL